MDHRVLRGALLVSLAGLAACGPSDEPVPAPKSGAGQAQDLLREKVDRASFTAREEADLENAMNDRFPQGSRVTEHYTFRFDGKPTSCGYVRANRSGRLQRYIYRNDFVMTEQGVSSSDFAMFWQICTAGGAV